MPDYTSFGFVYVTQETLSQVMGMAFYPQINLRSQMDKTELEQAAAVALDRISKDWPLNMSLSLRWEL